MTPEPPPAVRYPVAAVGIRAGAPEVFLHPDLADALGTHLMDRVHVTSAAGRTVTALVNIAEALVEAGTVGLSAELLARLAILEGEKVAVRPAPRPPSVEAIRRKLEGQRLSPEEMRTVMTDIAAGQLTAIELTAYAAAIFVRGMDTDETVACIQAMVETGERIQFDNGPILDVHSIGGVPGNKYAPIAVAIVAANGLRIPKTSSRAISSACGTADFMEVICPVALGAPRIKAITEKVGATLAWGGGVNMAPADDEIIRVEYPLAIDPQSQIIASVLSKKVAVGATKVLIDIPAGPGAKVPDEAQARRLAHEFIRVGERVGLEVQCLVSRGDEPLGRAVGPVLEIQEALRILEGDHEPKPLVEKACIVAGRLLEMGGAAPAGRGQALAEETLRSGKALAKFKEIVAAQGGDPEVRSDRLRPGAHSVDVPAPVDGLVTAVDNRAIVAIARAAGAPRDKGAGLMLHTPIGTHVRAGIPLYTLHADHPGRLQDALRLAGALRPVRLSGGEVIGFVE